MGILLCEQNFRDVWIRNKSVRAEIGQILRAHTQTTAAKLVVRMLLHCIVSCIVRHRTPRLRGTPASRWRMRASMRWIQQCKPLQWVFSPLLGATNSRRIGAFSNARLSERALCCSRRRNAVFVASRIIRQMSDF